jgi:hypothetical protein
MSMSGILGYFKEDKLIEVLVKIITLSTLILQWEHGMNSALQCLIFLNT